MGMHDQKQNEEEEIKFRRNHRYKEDVTHKVMMIHHIKASRTILGSPPAMQDGGRQHKAVEKHVKSLSMLSSFSFSLLINILTNQHTQ